MHLPATEIDEMRGHIDLNVRAILAPVTPGASQPGGIRGGIFQQDRAQIFGRPQVTQGHADEFLARVAVVVDCGVVHL